MACSERCPSDADPGEVIALLRELAVQKGNRPQYFVDEAKRFLQTGICFPRTGMTKKMRKELGAAGGRGHRHRRCKRCGEISEAHRPGEAEA